MILFLSIRSLESSTKEISSIIFLFWDFIGEFSLFNLLSEIFISICSGLGSLFSSLISSWNKLIFLMSFILFKLSSWFLLFSCLFFSEYVLVLSIYTFCLLKVFLLVFLSSFIFLLFVNNNILFFGVSIFELLFFIFSWFSLFLSKCIKISLILPLLSCCWIGLITGVCNNSTLFLFSFPLFVIISIELSWILFDILGFKFFESL